MPYVENGLHFIGLEPSCLLTLGDEIPALLPSKDAERLAERAKMLMECIAKQTDNAAFKLPLKSPARKVLVNGHCRRKAFGFMGSVQQTLSCFPGTEVEAFETSCLGMAGSFSYRMQTQEFARQMAGLDLVPTVRKADVDTLNFADGTSCRIRILIRQAASPSTSTSSLKCH